MSKMFIYSFDNELTSQLTKQGYRLIKQHQDYAILAMRKGVKFNFDNIDKSKFRFSNTIRF